MDPDMEINAENMRVHEGEAFNEGEAGANEVNARETVVSEDATQTAVESAGMDQPH